MRQKHHEAIFHIPLGFPRANELVNDDLGPVGEITELCLPQHQGVGMGLCVAELVTKNSELGQVRIGSHETPLALLLVHCGFVDRVVVTWYVLVENVGVSVGEGTSLNILARQSNMVAILDQGGEGKSLSCAPINSFTLRNAFASRLKDFSDQSVEFSSI